MTGETESVPGRAEASDMAYIYNKVMPRRRLVTLAGHYDGAGQTALETE